MRASIPLRGLLAVALAAVFGAAMAQGTPPNPAVKDPAMGAGQRSSQNTSMGTTGTPTGGAAAPMAGSTATAPAAGPAARMGAGTDTRTASADMKPAKKKHAKKRRATRSDRG